MKTCATTPDWLLADFDFALPAECIAAEPVAVRDSAKLLHVRGVELRDKNVYDLPHLLRRDDLLVMNDTKVIPARIYGMRGEVKIEILLHKKLDNAQSWQVFARPAKRLHVGDVIEFAPDFSGEVTQKREDGEVVINFGKNDAEFFALLKTHGHVPLPPYIKRPDGDTESDRTNYQTVYAARDGAIAAPTAGLHFTTELLKTLENKGIERVAVTLHVGAGTFLPVKTERVRDHIMHSEWGEITKTAAEKINKAKSEGRRIVAIGTTSLRLLESAADDSGIIQPFNGETDIFITPGYRFKAVDALMTNFHLPKSTLFMLVSAFAGLENMRAAYAHAVKQGYRFYSYGDSSFLEKDSG